MCIEPSSHGRERASRAGARAAGALAVIAALSPLPAAAQPAEAIGKANALFQEGARKHGAGDLDGALIAFRKAQAILPAARTLFNIATLEMDLDQNVEANRDFEALVAAPDDSCTLDSSPCAEQAGAFLVAVRKKLGHLVVNVEPKSASLTLDGQAIAPSAWIKPGVLHTFKAVTAGQSVTKEVYLYAGAEHIESFDLRMDAPPPAAEARPVDLRPAMGPIASAPKEASIMPAPPPNDTQKAAGWVLTGAGNVLFGLGGFYGLQTLQTLEKHKQGGPDYLVNDARSSGDAATAICIGGAVLVGVGVTLLIASKTGKPLGALFRTSSLPSGVVW